MYNFAYNYVWVGDLVLLVQICKYGVIFLARFLIN
jgi:hypothetical protein